MTVVATGFPPLARLADLEKCHGGFDDVAHWVASVIEGDQASASANSAELWLAVLLSAFKPEERRSVLPFR